MKNTLVLILLVIVFICGIYSSQYIIPPLEGKIIDSEPQNPTFIVTNVIDGDTVDLQDGERVRLIGINTPERGQPGFEEATERLKELILNKQVSLEMDKSNRDKYGRLLRHIFINNENVGHILLIEGYANSFFISPDFKYKEEFDRAEIYAKENGLGIWASSDYRDCIGIAYFHYNAEGNDKDNLNDEYVKFKSSCDFGISMKQWKVKDEATHIYEFPEFVLAAHQMVTLYTGSGTDSSDNLYWGETWSIWNNDGDTLYLWDNEGKLVLEYEYTN